MYCKNKLYLLCEDDCHYYEESEINTQDLPKLLEDLKELNSLITDGKVKESSNNRWTITHREKDNDLVNIAINGLIITHDVFWTPDLVKLIEQTIEGLGVVIN